MHRANAIRVLIAGQENMFRAKLGRPAGRSSRVRVMAQADSAEEAVTLTLAHHPDLVLMDMAAR